MTKTFEFTKGAFRLWYKLHIKVFAARLTGEVVGVKKAWEEKTVGGVPKHPTKHLSAPKHPHQATNPCSQTSLPQQLLPPYQLMTDFQGLGPISIVILTFESFMSFGIIHKGRGQVYSTAQIERCRKWKRRGKHSSGEINVRRFSFRAVLQISWCFLQAMQDQGWWSGLAILAISIDQPFNKGLWSRSKSVGWEISCKLIISISLVAIQIIKGETSQERILATHLLEFL